MDEWLTVADAAKLIDVDPDWIRKLCQRKVIECKKFGHVWMVSRASVEAYAKTDRKPGPKPKP